MLESLGIVVGLDGVAGVTGGCCEGTALMEVMSVIENPPPASGRGRGNPVGEDEADGSGRLTVLGGTVEATAAREEVDPAWVLSSKSITCVSGGNAVVLTLGLFRLRLSFAGIFSLLPLLRLEGRAP